jgi:hypothetical protein
MNKYKDRTFKGFISGTTGIMEAFLIAIFKVRFEIMRLKMASSPSSVPHPNGTMSSESTTVLEGGGSVESTTTVDTSNQLIRQIPLTERDVEAFRKSLNVKTIYRVIQDRFEPLIFIIRKERAQSYCEGKLILLLLVISYHDHAYPPCCLLRVSWSRSSR